MPSSNKNKLGSIDEAGSKTLEENTRYSTTVPLDDIGADWNQEISPTMRNRTASEREQYQIELMEKMKGDRKSTNDGQFFYDANIHMSSERLKMHDYTAIWPWVMLRFEDENDELEFMRDRLVVAGVLWVRICIICLFAFYVMNEGADQTIFKDKMTSEAKTNRQLFRIAGQVVPSLIWFFLTFTGESIYQPYYIAIQSFFTLILGFSSVFISMIGGDPDHGPQLLYIFVVWVFLRIPFRAASVVCWLIWLCYSVPLFAGIVIPENTYTWFYLAAGNACLMVAAYSAEHNNRDEFSVQKAIQFQQDISQGIMENLLPFHIMERMKQDAAAAADEDDDNYGSAPNVIAEQHEQVSVLFSDICGFTKYCGSITPQEVIVFLNDLYTTLDKVCEENSVYKVETIGDAYFVSSGCPSAACKDGMTTYYSGDPKTDAINIVQCGLGMTQALRQVMLRNRYDHFKPHEMVEVVYKRTWLPAQVLKCEWNQGSQDALTGEMITIGFTDKSLGMATHDAGAGMIRKLDMEPHPIGELVLAIDTLTKERVIATVKDVDRTRADCYLVKEDNSTKEFWTAQAYLTPRMRIGIHTGEVIAGVVGYKMPRYHLFGDTVNVAETMESSGVKDYVQVSETTEALIRDYYILEPRDEEDQKKITHETGVKLSYLIKGFKEGFNGNRGADADTYETL